MAKALTTYAQRQLTNADIKIDFIFYINGVDYTSYLINWNIEYSVEFGSASATFTLNNNEGIFGESGANKINVGDVVDFDEKFGGDTETYHKFYGIVNQRSIVKNSTSRTITLVCLDYISSLQHWDIDYEAEATKVKVENEVLEPVYLTAPNDTLATLFNFSRNALAQDPKPVLMIKNKNTAAEDPAYDGFTIDYENGQLKLGFPLNAKDNYDLTAISYYYYPIGLYAEDVLEELLTQPDGYGNYLFGETSATDVITNHLTDTFQNANGSSEDYLLPNYTSSEIDLYFEVSEDIREGATSIVIESTTGLPESGEASINGDTFTWSSKGSDGITLEGIPSTGSYALSEHKSGDYVKYTETYVAGRVWYLTYSNIVTNMTSTDFTIPGGSFKYLDKRNGRIILESAISTSATVKSINYSFKTLQATGIELNKITFRSRELENRFEAIKKLKKYLAPNYIIRTVGDNKIWASYLTQKDTEDYTLQVSTGVNFMEDEDLYTRVIFYGKNNNPTNLMFEDGIDFVASGGSYIARAVAAELVPLREEDNYYVYGPYIGGGTDKDGNQLITKWSPNIANNSAIGNASWQNPTYAQFDDNLEASVSGGTRSNYLEVTGFNFGIPDDATIKGILVAIKKRGDGSITDDTIKLIGNNVVGVENKASTDTWSTTRQYSFYGNSGDDWSEALTPTIVNHSSFGVAISCNIISGTAYIDAVTVTVIAEFTPTTAPSNNIGLGRIIANSIKPIVYVNGVAIDNNSKLISGQQVYLEVTTRTETTVSGGGK